MLMISALC